MINVKSDPRSKITEEARRAINQETEAFYNVITASKESFDQIKDAKKSLDLSKKIIEMQEDTLQKDLKKEMKIISSSLDSLSNLFMDPEGLKGIQRNPNTLTTRLWTARRYIGSSWEKPGQKCDESRRQCKTKMPKRQSVPLIILFKETTKYSRKPSTDLK